MRTFLVLLLASLLAGPAHAQREARDRRERSERFTPPSHMSQDELRRLREDVNSARGNYEHERRESRRAQRMAPEEREKLMRDVQDANRAMRRR